RPTYVTFTPRPPPRSPPFPYTTLFRSVHDETVADPVGVTRLGFDVGVLHELGLEVAFHHDVRRFERSGHVALFDPPFDEDVAVPATVQLRSAGATGVVDVEDRRFGLPRDGELGYCLLEDVGCADDHRHRLSPIAGLGFSEDGLVLETGQHPELVATGHVPGGADVDHAGMLLQEPPDVADPEPG